MLLDKSGKTPRYLQLKEILKEKIVGGEYTAGQMLPSEREICALYGISRMTARQAMQELDKEGYLYKVQGRGTFVSSGKIEQSLATLTSFSEDMMRMGRVPGSRILAIRNVKADARLSKQLSLAIGEDLLLFSRIRLADGVPISIENAYLNADLVRGIDIDGIESFSLYRYLRNTLHISLSRAAESIEATALTGKRAQLLEVPENTIGLLMNRTTYTDKNVPVEYAQSYYRGDIYKFVIELKQPSVR